MSGGIKAWQGYRATGSYNAGLHLIPEGMSGVDMLALAWAMEDGARAFYERAGEVFGGTEPGVAFRGLARAEVGHMDAIYNSYREVWPEGRPGIVETPGHMEGGVEVEAVLGWLGEAGRRAEDALDAAMQLEVNALDFYMRLVGRIGDDRPEVAGILGRVIEEERAHLKRLGTILDGLAFRAV